EKPVQQSRLPLGVVDGLKLVELLLRSSTQDSIDVGLQDRFRVSRIDVRQQVERRSARYTQQLCVEVERCEVRIEVFQDPEQIRNGAVFSRVFLRADAKATFGPQR